MTLEMNMDDTQEHYKPRQCGDQSRELLAILGPESDNDVIESDEDGHNDDVESDDDCQQFMRQGELDYTPSLSDSDDTEEYVTEDDGDDTS